MKTRKRYNQVPHLTQNTTWESNKNTINITNKSQEVSPFQAGDHVAAMNRRASMRNTRHKKHEWSTKEVWPWNGQSLFKPFSPIVVCSLIYLCTLIAYIANNVNPDKTTLTGSVWSWLILFATSIVNKKIGRIRVNQSLVCLWQFLLWWLRPEFFY